MITCITEKMCWKLAVKFLLINKDITENEYMHMHDMDKMRDSGYSISSNILKKVHDVIDVYPEALSELVKDEADFLINGNITNELLWTSYLIECLLDGEIDDIKYKQYRNAIDFSLPLGKKEYYLINDILNYMRIKHMKRVPSLINDFKNPSFEVLMTANELSSTHV